MDIEQIKIALDDSDPQQRMKGIRELRNYEANIAAPLLLNHVDDREFLVRSFVAMGLGRKQSDAAFAALLAMIEDDRDPNVRAEAANSLSFYGDVAVDHYHQYVVSNIIFYVFNIHFSFVYLLPLWFDFGLQIIALLIQSFFP